MARGYAAQVVADGAFAYWRLDERSGATVADAVGALTCLLVGPVVLGVPGALADGNPAMAFPGGTARVVMPVMTLPGICSVEAWVQQAPADVSGMDMIWTNRSFNHDFANPFLYLNNGCPQFGSGSAGAVVAPQSLADGQWHHVVGVSGGSPRYLELWVDGVLTTGANSYTLPETTGDGYIGYDAGDEGAVLAVDEVALYPVALTPAQIARHYALRTVPALVPPDASDLDNAIVARLGGDLVLLNLMPNGVYFGLAPEKSTQYVLVSLAESDDVLMFGGRAYETYVYAVKAVELSTVVGTRNIKAAAARIDAILDPPPPAPPLALTIPGYALKLSRRRGRIRYPEIDAVDRSIRWEHRGAEYDVWVSPLTS